MKENELKNNFKIPENYFDDLKNEIFLNNLKNNKSFDIPTDYFNGLEQNIMDNNQPVKKEGKVIHFNFWWAVASIVLLALVALPFMLNIKEEKNNKVVDVKVENQVYEKIYDSYIVDGSALDKKSPNVTLDDSDYVIYNY